MFSVTSDVEIANISELRTKASDITKKIGEKKHIIITKNNEPTMVILNFKEYQELISLVEKYEDEYFGKIAAERLETLDNKKALPIEKVEELVGL